MSGTDTAEPRVLQPSLQRLSWGSTASLSQPPQGEPAGHREPCSYVSEAQQHLPQVPSCTSQRTEQAGKGGLFFGCSRKGAALMSWVRFGSAESHFLKARTPELSPAGQPLWLGGQEWAFPAISCTGWAKSRTTGITSLCLWRNGVIQRHFPGVFPERQK